MKICKLLFFFILFHSSDGLANVRQPLAVNGVIDLRETAGNSFIVRLQGNWEFYWGKMLGPQDFTGNEKIKPDFYGRVPSYWTDYPKDSVKTSPMGFATYRLIVLLPPGFRNSMGFDMPVFDSSYDIFLTKYMEKQNRKRSRVIPI
jgi:hypothetical protein